MKKSINHLKINGINDTQAVTYNNGVINFIGSNPIIFGGGENED